jgi:hypothetical protein
MTLGEHDMKRFLAATILAVSLAPMGALAQERVGDAALGGLSGAIVLGPVGAVAGIVVGYAAGPAISRSWGLRRSGARYPDRAARHPTGSLANNAGMKQAAIQSVSAVSPKPASGARRTWDSPPVVGFE